MNKKSPDQSENTIKSVLRILFVVRQHISDLLAQDKAKYEKFSEMREKYQDQLDNFKQADDEIKKYLSLGISESVIESEMKMKLNTYYKDRDKILSDFQTFDDQLENLRINNEKSDFLIAKIEAMENELLSYFMPDEEVDMEKVARLMIEVEKMFAEDTIKRPDRFK